MASKDDVLPAGKYELTAQWDEMTSKPGQPFTFVRHAPGDVISVDQETANRIRRVLVKPGEQQRAAADRHRAEAERLQALADESEARAKEHESAAKDVAKQTPAKQ